MPVIYTNSIIINNIFLSVGESIGRKLLDRKDLCLIAFMCLLATNLLLRHERRGWTILATNVSVDNRYAKHTWAFKAKISFVPNTVPLIIFVHWLQHMMSSRITQQGKWLLPEPHFIGHNSILFFCHKEMREKVAEKQEKQTRQEQWRWSDGCYLCLFRLVPFSPSFPGLC